MNDMGAAYLELLDLSEDERRMLTRFEARDLLQRIEEDVATNTEAMRTSHPAQSLSSSRRSAATRCAAA